MQWGVLSRNSFYYSDLCLIHSTVPKSFKLLDSIWGIISFLLNIYLFIMKANTVPNFKVFLIFSMAQQPLVGQVLLIIEASRSH